MKIKALLFVMFGIMTSSAYAEINKEVLICFVLDESGSMADRKAQTVDGFNEYISGIKAKDLSARFSLMRFNTAKSAFTFLNLPLKEVGKLADYSPENGTPLYDAVGSAIKRMEGFKCMHNEILMVIMTDGLENSSREYGQRQVFDMIQTKQGNGWNFVYLGANQDSWAVGQQLGFHRGNVMDFDADNIRGTMKHLIVPTAASVNTSVNTAGETKIDNFFAK